MLRQDYLLRLIEQIGQVIARIRELVLGGGVVPDLELRESAAAAGFDLGLLRILTTDSLDALVNPTARSDALRSVLVAELLFADALICRSRNDEVALEDRLDKMTAMFESAERDDDPVRRSLVADRIATLREMVRAEGLHSGQT